MHNSTAELVMEWLVTRKSILELYHVSKSIPDEICWNSIDVVVCYASAPYEFRSIFMWKAALRCNIWEWVYSGPTNENHI